MNDKGYGGFAARLTRPDGRTEGAPRPAPGQVVSVNRITIGPGKSYSVPLLVNLWFDLDGPGRYTLDVVITKPLRNESGRIVVPYPPGGHLVFEVALAIPAG